MDKISCNVVLVGLGMVCLASVGVLISNLVFGSVVGQYWSAHGVVGGGLVGLGGCLVSFIKLKRTIV